MDPLLLSERAWTAPAGEDHGHGAGRHPLCLVRDYPKGDCLGPEIYRTTTAALVQAANRGVRLALTDDGEHILAGPRELLTDELRALICQAHEGLVRQLLFRRALDYYTHRLRRAGGLRCSDGARQVAWTTGYGAVAADYDDLLNEAWQRSDLREFRKVLREWLKGRLRTCCASDAAGRARDESEPAAQPVLVEVR